MRRRLVVPLALAATLVVADQVVNHIVLADGHLLGRRVAPFDPPLFTPAQENHLRLVERILAGDEELAARSTFDPELGWCPRPEQEIEDGLYVHDWAGSRVGLRPLPREDVPGATRVVAIGGSFTQGAEVRAEQTWLAELERRRPNLEVANLGVGGYGLDQAYLRFLRDGRPLAPDEVWFGLLPEACLRVTTNFPPACHHWSSVAAFKPRFLIDGVEPRLVPSPVSTHADYPRLLGDQRAFLAAVGESDLWVRRAPRAFAPDGSSWLHRSGLGRLFLTFREAGGRDPERWLADPESEAFRVMDGILGLLERDVTILGARLRVVVLPSRRDLEQRRDAGSGYWAPLVERLRAQGVDVLDASDALLAAGVLADGTAWMPGEHYGPSANRVVADAVAAAWLP